jgi:hypothetical protein
MKQRTISSITFDKINGPLEEIYGSLTSEGMKRMLFYIRNILLIPDFTIEIEAPNRIIRVKTHIPGVIVKPKDKSIETMKRFSGSSEYMIIFERG